MKRRNYAYTWRYGWHWVWEALRHGHGPIVALRQLYWALIRGHDGETCQDCGRPYLLWRSPDDLYLDLIGSRHGLFCLKCFDARADEAGVILIWRPEVFHVR